MLVRRAAKQPAAPAKAIFPSPRRGEGARGRGACRNHCLEAFRLRIDHIVEQSGMGPGPYTFRVTDYYGNTLIDSGIALAADGDVSGKAQFRQQR